VSRRKLLADKPPPFDCWRLREYLISAKIIVAAEKPPTKEACSLLAQRILSAQNQVEPWRNELLLLKRRGDLIAPAMRALIDALAALDANFHSILTSSSQAITEEQLEREQGALEMFRRAVSATLAAGGYLTYLSAFGQREEAEGVRKIILEPDLPDDPRDGWDRDDPPPVFWHDYVEDVVEWFREAMLTTNKTAPGLGDKNSLSRFLAAVIPFISGETPSETTIMRYLQRKRDREGE
jgi:hypothetical protein